jgi:hypothetical protein
MKIDVLMDMNDNQRELFHFQDKCFNLRTGQVRRREKSDFVTKCLSYNYGPRDEANIKAIETKLRMIQPQDTGYEWVLSWLGYNLTGFTNAQKFNLNIGHTSSNAKSSVFHLMTNSFPIYVKQMGNKAFDDANAQWPKQFGCLIDYPYRMVWMNEWGKKVIDEDRFCNFVDGKPFPIPVIYEKAEVTITPHCKLNAASNNDPNIRGATKGTFRRGIQTPFESEFVDDGTEDPAIHRYKDDKGEFTMKFKNDVFKLAFFHLLQPYATRYCKEMALRIPEFFSAGFKRMVDDQDSFSAVFDHFTITRSLLDVYPKDKVMSWLGSDTCPVTGSVSFHWKLVLHKFKSKGVKYDSQMRKTINGRVYKGFFQKVKFTPGH